MFFIYMLRCTDGSLYSGITTDIERRFREHAAKDGKGAKYTASHRPVGVASLWQTEEKKDAMRLEYRLKKLVKADKEKLVAEPMKLDKYFDGKLDCSLFSVCEIPEELKINERRD